MFSLENEFHATITASFEGATTAYPVPLSVSFTQSVQQITQSQLIVCISVWLQMQVTNAVVSSFTQVSLTELTLALTPQEPGEITLTLDTSVKSVSGRTLAAPPPLPSPTRAPWSPSPPCWPTTATRCFP